MRNFALSAIVTIAFATYSSVSAEEPLSRFDTAWGSLQRLVVGDVVGFIGLVDSRPEDGRLVLPEKFPPIVACKTYYSGANADFYLPLDFDPATGAATIQLPDESEMPRKLIETIVAENVTQNVDGVIVFPANVAKVVGEKAKLESNGTHHRIGFWTDPADFVTWDYDATRWGRYRVLLTYSTESPDGGVATIEMGGEKIDVELPSTGNWYRYRTIEAGNLYLATDGKLELTVRAKKLSGAALMNLKAVLLLPTYESDERAVQAEDGSVTLHARDARVQGTKLRYEPKPEKNTLGYWTEQRDNAAWGFDLKEPGSFDVEVSLGCGAGQGGSKMVLMAGTAGSPLIFDVEETGHFQNFVPRIVGRLRYDEAGRHYLVVLPEEIAKAAACDIRQIRLIPVEEPALDPADAPKP